jgi:uncharacterized protein (DUF2141 family)
MGVDSGRRLKASGRLSCKRKAALMAAVLIAAMRIHAQDPTKSPKQDSPATSKRCEVRGIVVAADTGLPLKSATVILAAMSKEDVKAGAEPNRLEEEVATETTDTSGHFVFDDVPAGDYAVRGSKAGFIPATYHHTDGDAGARIGLKPGDKVDTVRLSLTRGGVIIGSVTDEAGEPVAGVMVNAQSPAARIGGDPSHRDRHAITNDLGEYRIYSLQPGHYYVTATDTGFSDAGTSIVVTLGSRKKPRHTYPRIYYPGVFRISEAQKIRVDSGQEMHIDFSLKMEKLLNIAGRVVTPDGKPAAKARVRLSDNTTLGRSFLYLDVMVECDTEGSFVFRGVLPGSYTVTATLDYEVEADQAQEYSADQQIELAGNSLSGLQLQLIQPVTISGKVTAEPGTKLELDKLWIILDKEADYARNSAYPKPDGTFVIGGLTRPPLFLTIFGLPEGWCVLSAYLGTQNVLENGLWFPDPSAKGKETLRIRVGPGAARIEGVVLQGNAPVAKAQVKLFQESSNEQKIPFRQLREYTQTSNEGHFVFTNLSPGRYSALAFATDAEEDGFPPEEGASLVISQRELKTLKFKIPKTTE